MLGKWSHKMEGARFWSMDSWYPRKLLPVTFDIFLLSLANVCSPKSNISQTITLLYVRVKRGNKHTAIREISSHIQKSPARWHTVLKITIIGEVVSDKLKKYGYALNFPNNWLSRQLRCGKDKHPLTSLPSESCKRQTGVCGSLISNSRKKKKHGYVGFAPNDSTEKHFWSVSEEHVFYCKSSLDLQQPMVNVTATS